MEDRFQEQGKQRPPAMSGDLSYASAPDGTPRQRQRVLVVDADDSLLAFAAEALHSFRPGFEVATARDEEAARGWLDTFEPQVIVYGVPNGSRSTERVPESSAARWGEGPLLGDPRTLSCGLVVMADDPSFARRLGPAAVRARAILPRPPALRQLIETVREVSSGSRESFEAPVLHASNMRGRIP